MNKTKVRKCAKLLLKFIADRRPLAEQGPDEPKSNWSIRKDYCSDRWDRCILEINDIKVELVAPTKYAQDISAWIDNVAFALYPRERMVLQQEVQKTRDWLTKRSHRRLVDKLIMAMTTPRDPEPAADTPKETP
jgi:hypothetical protein